MRSLLGSLVALAALPGCATTWLAWEIGMKAPPFDENERKAAVPLPGVTERLTATVHLAGPPPPPSSSSSTTTTPPPAPVPRSTELLVECAVTQTGREEVHRASTRYGAKWKVTTACFFVVEGAIAAIGLLPRDASTGDRLFGAWMGVDALGTAILFFAPRRDVYTKAEREETIPIRNDCPEGLVLELDGRPVPVDATGHVGELGQALLERHVVSAPGPIVVAAAGQRAEVPLDAATRCAWARARESAKAEELCKEATSAPAPAATPQLSVTVTLGVPPGTFSAPPPAAPTVSSRARVSW